MAETNYMLQKTDDDKYLKLSEFDGSGSGGGQGASNYNSKIITVNVVGGYNVLDNEAITDSNTKSATIDIDGVSTECLELTDSKITELNNKLAKQGRGFDFNASTVEIKIKIVGVGSDGEQHIEEGTVENVGMLFSPLSIDYNFKTITHVYFIGVENAPTEKVTLGFNNTYYLDETLSNDSIIQYLSKTGISDSDISVSKLNNNSIEISGVSEAGENAKVYCIYYEILD